MTETAEVVIIGGGIVGSSVAYHLAEGGCTDVLIIEREAKQGLGSTGKSAGGVRAQFSTAVNRKMSLYSIAFFEKFEELTGHEPGYKPHGYLFLATEERHLAFLHSIAGELAGLGHDDVEFLSPDEIKRRIPDLETTDLLGGAYRPGDGFVDPYSLMMGFSQKARENGARLWLGTEVTGIEVVDGRVAEVLTTHGRVSTPNIVNAGGAWARLVARMAGVDLPVDPLRRQIINTERFDRFPAPLPMVIDMSNGFHFRREGPGILMACAEDKETWGFQTIFDPGFIERTLGFAVKRAPSFADAEVNSRRCWAGLYEVTPDHHAVIDRAPGVEGLFFANGFSGHGVMHSPATGRIVADLVLGRELPFAEARDLSAERFATGRLIEEAAVL